MRKRIAALAGLWLGAAAAVAGWAQSDTERVQADQIAELQRQVQVLAGELSTLRTRSAVPEAPALESVHGMGPAASKVYSVAGGLSMGGYAEAYYERSLEDDTDDVQRATSDLNAVLYMGYKFSDRILFNSEIEIEHASEAFVELAQLDLLLRPELNLRTGLMLMPVGFVNEVHEPPFYYGVALPEVESRIIPATWRENGVGVFGTLGESLSYRAYMVNGLNAEGFTARGLRGGRQKGIQTRSRDLAFVSRLDFEPAPGLQIGGSFYRGNSGQGAVVEGQSLPSASTQLWEVHAQFRSRGLHLRGLYAQADLGDTGELSSALGETIGERMLGGYVELAYDLMPWLNPGSGSTLAPFFRFEYIDTQNRMPRGFAAQPGERQRLFVPGLQYKPHPQVVLKGEYRRVSPLSGEDSNEFRLGMGLAF